ncbi:MAG TPA: hypothetical protein VGY91_13530 [Chthoniobacterales bacterium]|jgi:hypothetical protein|nr:hypothetical protein [Chthoniobacterales bacterium]
MLIHRLNEDSIEFADIEPIEADLLRQIPVLCDVRGDSRAESRLFSNPADSGEVQFLTDWEEYVRPELRHIFVSARATVEKDLGTMVDRAGFPSRLVILCAHGEAWLNALNQARLILATKFEFSDEELSLHEVPRSFSRRDLVLLQINFYAAIQERIIDTLEGCTDADGRE